jgi:tricorn protease
MRLSLTLGMLVLFASVGCTARPASAARPVAGGNVDLPRYPSISPDGKSIVFSWHGDLWKVPSEGGTALRLTSHPADDLTSAWSPDGASVAFLSNRGGDFNVHVMSADGTDVRQVTSTDRPLTLNGWMTTPDGSRRIVLSVREEMDVYPGFRPASVSVDSGETERLHDAFGLETSVSPDGKRLLFTRGMSGWWRRGYTGPDARELWLFDRTARTFIQLTRWAGNDGMGKWLDERRYVFLSTRPNHVANLFLRTLGDNDADAIALTGFAERDVEWFDVARDGKTIVFSRWGRLYTLDANKPKQPVALTIVAADEEAERIVKDVSRSVTEAALSPDGKTLAVVAYGQVYVRSVEAKSPTRRVSTGVARCSDIAWSADGMRLFFVSRESGVEEIVSATVRLTREDARKEIEAANRAATQTTTQPATLPATQPGTQPATQPATQASTLAATTSTTSDESAGATTNATASATTDTTASATTRSSATATSTVTTTSATTTSATTSGSATKPDPARWADAVAFDLETFSRSDEGDQAPVPSPDGTKLALRRGNGTLVVIDLHNREAKTLFAGWSTQLEYAWSPDGRWIAYVTEDQNFNSDIWVVDADGTTPAVNITRHPDNDYSPRFSADGRVLAFLSQRKDNEPDVYMVWLDKSMESLTPVELDAYFKDAAASAKTRKPPTTTTGPSTRPSARVGDETAVKPKRPPLEKPDLDDAWLRLRRVTTFPGNEGSLLLAPAGDRFYFLATPGTQRGLYTATLEPGEPRKLGTTAVSPQHLSLSGEQLVFVDQSRAGIMKLPAGETEFLDIADKLTLDARAFGRARFVEASRVMATQFYHPTMKGLDWAALTKRYAALADAARTGSEFEYVVSRLFGELNASHTGIDLPDPPQPNRRSPGKLGITVRRVADGFEVLSVLGEGPAGKGWSKLLVGDIITAIDFVKPEPSATLDTLLLGKAGQETVVTVRRTLPGESSRDFHLLLTPISSTQLTPLVYDDWRLRNAKLVEDWSDGQLGYIHVRGMDQNSLDIFERDLFAAAHGKKGLVIDVRNNGGGWTSDRLLASIMAPRHAYTVPRGMDPSVRDGYPQDRLFIQRYDLPINMLCNEKSFSNAEIIAHAFKTLKRGTLVGQQTAGGVISTGSTTLVDGTTVRVPFRGWYLPDGTDMENNGAIPDLLVPQTPEDESRGEDSQLRAAVADLLKRVK